MLLCLTHWNVWNFLLNWDLRVFSSHCNICICSSHNDVTMFGRLQHYYVWHLQNLEMFATLWRQDICITLEREEMLIIWRWQGDVWHIAMSIYVHHIVTLLSPFRPQTYVRHIAMLLCLADCNVATFLTLWCYYVRHIETQYFHHIAMLCVHHSEDLLCLVDFNVTMFNTLQNFEFFVTLRLCNKCITMQHQQMFITLWR
jgi:hypothetical protein